MIVNNKRQSLSSSLLNENDLHLKGLLITMFRTQSPREREEMEVASPCRRVLMAASLLAAAGTAHAAPTADQLQKQIQELQAQVEALAKQQEAQAAQPRSALDRTHIGGYGELHYNNLDSEREIDFHRFVLYVGHDFSERVRFVSELELEHALAGEGKPGEIELEQAYVQFDLPAQQHARAGLFLVPVGILNETHEPTTFYGVERNPIEGAILPSTWWEAGAAAGGRFGDTGLSYDLAVHSGLAMPFAGGSAYLPRSGRQKVASARADDLAYTGRLRWQGIPGLELAGSAQWQSDATQSLDTETVSALLTEAHVVVEKGWFGARALYANWEFDGAGPAAVGRDRQDGYYGELSVRPWQAFGVFARHNIWDNGGIGETEREQTDVGFNYWPVANVVLKADYQNQEGAVDDDGFNLGVGYRF